MCAVAAYMFTICFFLLLFKLVIFYLSRSRSVVVVHSIGFPIINVCPFLVHKLQFNDFNELKIQIRFLHLSSSSLTSFLLLLCSNTESFSGQMQETRLFHLATLHRSWVGICSMFLLNSMIRCNEKEHFDIS